MQLKWYYELNQFAVKSSLLCKFVVQGIKTQTPRLAFQAQGRLPTTRYKDVRGKRRLEDIALRDECAGQASGSVSHFG